MQSSFVSCQNEHGYVYECLSLHSFRDMFPDKRRKVPNLGPFCYVYYLLYDIGIHDGISYQSIAWTTKLQTVTVKHLYLVLWMN